MIIPEEVICKTCEKVFCCSECREKHELKTHAIVVHSSNNEAILHLFCAICQKKPVILHAEIRRELLLHIAENHLPLNCQKCFRLYTRIEDLLHFSKCVQNDNSCKLEASASTDIQIKKETTLSPQKSIAIASSVSTQTSPIRVLESNDSHLTPMSMINIRWKAKSKVTEEFISDSVSSIKNISSFNNSSIRKSIGIGIPITKGKLVRSTSTPLQAEIFAKPKEQAFNVFGGHVSSIYNSGSDQEGSPPLVPPIGSPSKKPVETVTRYQKPRARGKMFVAVTPLRQVMSKSIQKAIAEHGIVGSRGVGFNRKKMFDSIDTSGDISEKSNENSPMDLRLSPALRRTQSEIISRESHLEFFKTLPRVPSQKPHREILLSATKKTTESIIITSSTCESLSENKQTCDQSSNSVYQSCQSVEIITSTSTELNGVNVKQSDVVLDINMLTTGIPPLTPRIPNSGVLTNKKLIKFETPVIAQKSKTNKLSPDEKFFTPSSTPIRPSKVCKNIGNSWPDSLPRTFHSMEEQEDNIESYGSNYTDVAFEDEVFIENKKPEQSRSKLWSIVASMIGLPSRNGRDDIQKSKDDTSSNSNSTSLIKRCASYAGSLVRQKSVTEDYNCPALKRKRTYTADSHTINATRSNCTDFDFTCSESKRFRIHGRKPIKRMRYKN